MIELKVGDYVYTGYYYGRATVGVVTRVYEKTYLVRLEYNSHGVKIDKRTLCTQKNESVFLPVSGREAFDKIFDRKPYITRIMNLESQVESLRNSVRKVARQIAADAGVLKKLCDRDYYDCLNGGYDK